MNNNNSILTRVAITITPRLNNALYSPLFQQCGGITGFFQESDANIKLLFKENNLTTGAFPMVAASRRGAEKHGKTPYPNLRD